MCERWAKKVSFFIKVLLVLFLNIFYSSVYADTGDVVSWSKHTVKTKFTRSLDTHIYELIEGDLFVLPNGNPRIQSWWFIIETVEWYNILTTWTTLCSQIARLTLERLTGKTSGYGRSESIPKWDAITLIRWWIKHKLLDSLWTLSGSISWFNTVWYIRHTISNKLSKSKHIIWDMYLYHPTSWWYNQGHRVVLLRWSDELWYILDPVLWSFHARPKSLDEYLNSILEIKQGSVLYIGRWWKGTHRSS